MIRLTNARAMIKRDFLIPSDLYAFDTFIPTGIHTINSITANMPIVGPYSMKG